MNFVGKIAALGVVPLCAYSVVVFDCDGVMLDSNGLKTDVFRQVLGRHGFSPAEIDAFSAYQVRNFGTSRYRLFEAAAAGQFGERRDVSVEDLLDDFGALCRTGYLRQPETPGLRDALERAAGGGRPLYVVSGSDEAELRWVLAELRLGGYFEKIFGSPTPKTDNMRKLKAERIANGAPGDEPTLFIGDAFSDMEAARAVGADFAFMARYSTVREKLEPAALAAGSYVIEDLTQLG